MNSIGDSRHSVIVCLSVLCTTPDTLLSLCGLRGRFVAQLTATRRTATEVQVQQQEGSPSPDWGVFPFKGKRDLACRRRSTYDTIYFYFQWVFPHVTVRNIYGFDWQTHSRVGRRLGSVVNVYEINTSDEALIINLFRFRVERSPGIKCRFITTLSILAHTIKIEIRHKPWININCVVMKSALIR